MKDIECPYCETEQDINHDDGYGYDENEVFEQECGSCGKTFVYTTHTSHSYDASKADCKNGGEHNLKKKHIFPEEFGVGVMLCADCGDDIVVDSEARDKAIKEYFEELK